jgi:hypothetical protein
MLLIVFLAGKDTQSLGKKEVRFFQRLSTLQTGFGNGSRI